MTQVCATIAYTDRDGNEQKIVKVAKSRQSQRETKRRREASEKGQRSEARALDKVKAFALCARDGDLLV